MVISGLCIDLLPVESHVITKPMLSDCQFDDAYIQRLFVQRTVVQRHLYIELLCNGRLKWHRHVQLDSCTDSWKTDTCTTGFLVQQTCEKQTTEQHTCTTRHLRLLVQSDIVQWRIEKKYYCTVRFIPTRLFKCRLHKGPLLKLLQISGCPTVHVSVVQLTVVQLAADQLASWQVLIDWKTLFHFWQV